MFPTNHGPQLNQTAPASAIMTERDGIDSTAVKEAKDLRREVARTLDLSKTPEVRKPEGKDPDQKFNELDLDKKLL